MISDWFSDLLFGVAGVNTGSLDTKKKVYFYRRGVL